MSYATSGGADQGRTSLDRHQIQITTYKSVTDKGHKRESLTLPQLEDRLHATAARAKDKLPLLKLALFGETRNENGTLRHGGNMGDITGIEVDYDGEVISFDDAVEKLTAAKLRCLGYTSPSHSVEKPRWRVLLPLSKDTDKKERTQLVERVNGIFNGALAAESFVAAQPYYYGYINRDTFETVLLDGDFIDKRQDLEPMAKAASAPRGATGDRVDDFSTFTIPQLIEHLIKRSQLKDKRELQWHWPMVHLTAKLAAAGSGEAEMIAALSVFCDGGASDPQLLDMVASAMRKFGPPPEITTAKQKRLAKMLAPKAEPAAVEIGTRPPRPADDATLGDKINYLLACYAWHATGDCVVDLYADSDLNCRQKLRSWNTEYAAWREVEEGPRGGKIVHRATDAWLVSPHRISVHGVRMAPGYDFPLFVEQPAGSPIALQFKNTYLPPHHTGDGEVDTFEDFLVHLIPDKRERDWFWQWLAHKWRHPEVPGSGIVFMARNTFGCGRGTLFKIAERLFGDRYVRQEDFDIVAGESSQGAFTDWATNCIIVCCDETQASPTAHRRGQKLSLYEKFKKVVDPANRRRVVRGKNIAAYSAEVFASYWLATNHADPFVIPANDRRIAVLTNGAPLAADLAARIYAWMDAPGSMAALARYLDAVVDLSGFEVRDPIETVGKTSMVEASHNEIEEALLDIADEAKDRPAFTVELLKAKLMSLPQLQDEEGLGWKVKAAIKTHTSRVPFKGSGQQRRTTFSGMYPRIIAFSSEAARVERMTDDEIRASLKAWNKPLGGYIPISLVRKPE